MSSRTVGLFKRWVEVRREERRAVLVAFVTLFMMVGAHSILETARDALFLATVPAEQLPIAYLAIAGAIAIVGQLTGNLRHWGIRGALLPGSLAICAVLTSLFWVGIDRANEAFLFVLYIWSGLVGTFVVGLFWLRVGDRFDVGQAKRLFPLIGIGGVAGATMGSITAGALLSAFPSRHLIFAASATYLLAGIWVAWMWGQDDGDPIESEYDRRSESMSRLEILRREPYLRRLSLLIAISMVTVTVVDYLFKSTVAANVPPDELGSFFATYYAVVNGLSAVVQVVIAPLLLSYLGVNRALILFPVLLLAGGFGLVVTGSVAAALVLKGVDGTLRHSLYRTGMEILYLPLSSDIRGRFKALIDGFAQRGGQAVASLAILGSSMVGVSQHHLAWGVLGLSLFWVFLGFRMRGGYLNLFRERLSLGRIDARTDIPDLDLSALEQLLKALNSVDDDTVLTALEMFQLYRRGSLIPALILYHPSPRVVDHAADVLAHGDREDVSAVAARLLQHEDPTVKGAALRLLVADAEAFAQHEDLVADSEDPVIRGMVTIGRFNAGEIGEEEAREQLSQVFEDATGTTLCGLAQAMRGNDSAVAHWALIEMAKRLDATLCREVAEAMAASPDPEYLPHLVDMIAIRSARPSVRKALVRIGEPALRYLEETTLEDDLPRRTLRHIPRSISRFGGQAAVDTLIRLYRRVNLGYFRFKALRGLGRLSADDPRLKFDREFLDEQIEASLRRVILMLDGRMNAASIRDRRRRFQHPAIDLLIDTMLGKELNSMERFFRFLAIRYPEQGVHEIFKGLMSEDSRVRAGSRELLENILPASYRFAAMALVDELPEQDKLARCTYFFDPSAGFNPVDIEAAFMLRLRGMLGSSSETIRLVAEHVVEQLDLDPDAHDEELGLLPDAALRVVSEGSV